MSYSLFDIVDISKLLSKKLLSKLLGIVFHWHDTNERFIILVIVLKEVYIALN